MSLVWLGWSLLFLAGWIALFFTTRSSEVRTEVLIASLVASVFGLTEPIFVPRYWDPPSLFNLAQTAGFDIESFIFAFSIGGIVVGLFERVFRVRHHDLPADGSRYSKRFSLAFITAVMLLMFSTEILFIPVNPIYAALSTLLAGGILTVYFRPDLRKKMTVSTFLFAAIYIAYFSILVILTPGYVPSVWDLRDLTGILILGIPIEEILFAISFGFFWSGVYDLYSWRTVEIVGREDSTA